VPACAELARTIYHADRYPIVLQDDIKEFLARRAQLAAWVALTNGTVIGHVALHA
jgi:hypothetical protein